MITNNYLFIYLFIYYCDLEMIIDFFNRNCKILNESYAYALCEERKNTFLCATSRNGNVCGGGDFKCKRNNKKNFFFF